MQDIQRNPASSNNYKLKTGRWLGVLPLKKDMAARFILRWLKSSFGTSFRVLLLKEMDWLVAAGFATWRVRPTEFAREKRTTYCAHDMQDVQRNLASSNNYIIRGSRQWGDWGVLPLKKDTAARCILRWLAASFAPWRVRPTEFTRGKKTTLCARWSNHTKQVYSSFFNPLKATGEFEIESVKGVHSVSFDWLIC